MRTKLAKWMVLPALALVAVVAWGADRVIRTTLLIDSPYNRPALRIEMPAGATANAIEITSGTNTVFTVGSSLTATRVALGVQAGSIQVTADGLATNYYVGAFGTTPRVVLTPTSAVPAGSNQVRVVTSDTIGFSVFGHTNVVYNWISVL